MTAREPVDTRSLDDVAEITAVDFLKIDIQGGELAVLRAGRDKLRRAVAVQTEVGFHRSTVSSPPSPRSIWNCATRASSRTGS